MKESPPGRSGIPSGIALGAPKTRATGVPLLILITGLAASSRQDEQNEVSRLFTY
jgi:hypothetical protein